MTRGPCACARTVTSVRAGPAARLRILRAPSIRSWLCDPIIMLWVIIHWVRAKYGKTCWRCWSTTAMPTERVALLYTGQPRAFSIAWQHDNHIKMLVTATRTLFHRFEVHTFVVAPIDAWHTNSTRAALLALPTLVQLLTYAPHATVHNDSSAQRHGISSDCMPLGFSWPPTAVSAVEASVKLFWRSREPFMPPQLAGLQLAIAARAVLDAEVRHAASYDAFVRLRWDVLLYAPLMLPRPLGQSARSTLLAHDSRFQDTIFFGGGRVLAFARASLPCHTGGPPQGLVHAAHAAAAGIERIISGPGGGPAAFLRLNRMARCIRVERLGGLFPMEVRGGKATSCCEPPPSPAGEDSVDNEKERDMLLGERGRDMHSGAGSSLLHVAQSVGMHDVASQRNATRWVDAGEPVRGWYARVRSDPAQCSTCEEALRTMHALHERARQDGYVVVLEGDSAARPCALEPGRAANGDRGAEYVAVMAALNRELSAARPGETVGWPGFLG